MNYQEIYESLGVNFNGSTSHDNAMADCPICTKRKHFFLNVSNGQWDCKSCGESGNLLSFFRRFHESNLEVTGEKEYRRLEEERHISANALAEWGLAYDGDQWWLPYANENSRIVSLRYWKGGKSGIRNIKGTSVALFGLEQLHSLTAPGTVYLCEGEWDAIALWSISDRANKAFFAIPGASTFKESWAKYFQGHDVVLCFDNDDAGRKGTQKTLKALGEGPASIRVVNWPEGTPEGFDVRDLVIAHGKKAESILEDMTTIEAERRNASSVVERIWFPGDLEPEQQPSFDEVRRVFKRTIEFDNNMEIGLKILLAHALSVDLPGDPIWTYIVGPPGCGKTLLLMSAQASDRCRFVSNLTPKSLVSGWNGPNNSDPSLLPRWNGRCAVLKDFTEILSQGELGKEDIYSTFRGAFDGYVHKPFGNGIVREYHNLRFALIAGVTQAVHADRQAMMGERFLKYEMLRGSEWKPDDVIYAAIDSVCNEGIIEASLADVVGRFLARSKVEPKDVPAFEGEFRDRLVGLAQIIAWLRARVEREKSSVERILYRPVREVGTRIAKQLSKLGRMIAYVEGKSAVDEPVYQIMERVAFDTTIGFHFDLIRAINDLGGSATSSEIQKSTHLPRSTIERALEDLMLLKVVSRAERAQNTKPGVNPTEYVVAEPLQELFEQAKLGLQSELVVRRRRFKVKKVTRRNAK